MYSSSYSRAKFGQEAREPLHHRKGKSCGYYMRIIFFFSSLIQSLIIVSLVLFLIYGQPEKSAEEKRVEVSDFSWCINLSFIYQMLRTRCFKQELPALNNYLCLVYKMLFKLPHIPGKKKKSLKEASITTGLFCFKHSMSKLRMFYERIAVIFFM